ncbi:DoxX family protein [Natrinema halophilum]|uniref:DoxX family protein n=1 Tax=Natrinema halophilum TaxID=1699371 RepID=A0A7D5KZH6_9EURY|nr:DoxX family protein [Natrinema halophilum]QLG49240.1 DoxX family protein [Natrinema halophilum]
MSSVRLENDQSTQRRILKWSRIALRLALVALIAKPALSKFVTYGTSVSFFDAIGMPIPSLTVIVAGLVEGVAIVLLLVGTRERIAILSLIPVMVVAVLYAGPSWKNIAVLVCCGAFLAEDIWMLAAPLWTADRSVE